MVRRTYEGAIASARLSAFEVGDADTGSVYEVSPDQMWQRALLPLPPGSEVAHMDPPGLPNEFTDLVKLIVAKTCAIFGVPSEVVLGAIGGAKVSLQNILQNRS